MLTKTRFVKTMTMLLLVAVIIATATTMNASQTVHETYVTAIKWPSWLSSKSLKALWEMVVGFFTPNCPCTQETLLENEEAIEVPEERLSDSAV